MSAANRSGPPTWLWGIVLVGIVLAFIYAGWDSRDVAPAADTGSTRPTVAAPPPNADFASWVEAGNEMMDSGEYAAAIQLYSRAIERDSTVAEIWVDRGACRHALGDVQLAREDFAAALKLAPRHRVAHFNMGIAWFTEQQADSARWWWERLLEIAPESPEAQRARGLLEQLPPEPSGT